MHGQCPVSVPSDPSPQPPIPLTCGSKPPTPILLFCSTLCPFKLLFHHQQIHLHPQSLWKTHNMPFALIKSWHFPHSFHLPWRSLKWSLLFSPMPTWYSQDSPGYCFQFKAITYQLYEKPSHYFAYIYTIRDLLCLQDLQSIPALPDWWTAEWCPATFTIGWLSTIKSSTISENFRGVMDNFLGSQFLELLHSNDFYLHVFLPHFPMSHLGSLRIKRKY